VKKIREEAEERKNLKADSLSPTKKQPIQTGNKTISHDKMLNGKINGTFSIGKKTKALTEKDLTEIELYKMLTKYIMSESSLREYGMPRADPYKKGNAILPILQSRAQKNDYESQIRTCSRCQKTYTVDERGMPAKFEACIFHQGRLWNERFNKTVDKKYSCCKNPAGSIGCDSSKYHVIDGYDNPDYCKNYVKTIAKKAPSDGFYGIYALDCEMCYTTVGLELIKVTVIDTQERVVFESLVKPSNPILDYNSRFSGIRKGDLDKVTTTLKQIHQELLTLFNDKTILIGHSLDSDLRALKMIHDTICDTTMIFPHKRGLPFRRALRNLTAEYLKEIIQDNGNHRIVSAIVSLCNCSNPVF
jgi:RNA exonuclease 1